MHQNKQRPVTPFRYLGSKYYLLHKILPLIPPHNIYLEPFCGSATVFFVKDLAKINVLNDIDQNIVNFFRVLQDPEKTQRLRFNPL